MTTRILFLVARLAVRLGINLNWLGDPVHTWRLRQSFWVSRL